MKASGVPVDFEQLYLSEVNHMMSVPLEDVVGSINRNRICIKGNCCISLKRKLVLSRWRAAVKIHVHMQVP